MKRLFLLSFILVFFTSMAFAHNPEGKHRGLSAEEKKELQEFKLKFLAEQIELKNDQIKLFNETYLQLENERRGYLKKEREIRKKLKGKNVSDAEYEKASREINDIKAKLAEVDEKYDKKFAKFLSQKQIFKLKEAEDAFLQKMRGCINKKKGEQAK